MKFILIILFLIGFQSIKAQTYYYVRVKIVKDGVHTQTNDDGHYMTFGKNCVYDSDENGYCMGNSNMKFIKAEKGIKTYYGTNYHGQNHCFISSDKSRINIKEDNVTFVYVRSTPSSTAKRREYQESSNSNIIVPLPNVPNNSSSSRPPSNHRVCPSCRGTGKGVDQIIYRPDYTGNQADEYCSKCGKWGSPHSHHTPDCKTCHGLGYIN